MKWILVDDAGGLRAVYGAPQPAGLLFTIEGQAARALIAVADDDPRLPDVAAQQLPAVAAQALVIIDHAAEATRLRSITPGAGQAATYILKAQRAREFAAAGYTGPVPALVQAKAAAAGLTAQAAADLIVATAGAWEALAAQIEEVREGGKAAVGAAADVAAVEVARDVALAALAAL